MYQIKRKNERSRRKYIIPICTVVLILCCFIMLHNKCGPKYAAREVIITCREYLLRGQQEDKAYGLYSYVLIKREPRDSLERDRNLALWHAYCGRFAQYKEYETLEIAKEYANVTYWPLKVTSDTQIPDEKRENEMFFIDSFDYARADVVLGQIPEMKTPGPFVIAYHYPLGKMMPQIPENNKILIFDLSRVDQELFSDVFDLFQNKVKDDPRTWKNKFDWELIRIHVCSALKIHGEPILEAATYVAEWIGDKFSGLKTLTASLPQ